MRCWPITLPKCHTWLRRPTPYIIGLVWKVGGRSVAAHEFKMLQIRRRPHVCYSQQLSCLYFCINWFILVSADRCTFRFVPLTVYVFGQFPRAVYLRRREENDEREEVGIGKRAERKEKGERGGRRRRRRFSGLSRREKRAGNSRSAAFTLIQSLGWCCALLLLLPCVCVCVCTCARVWWYRDTGLRWWTRLIAPATSERSTFTFS